MMQEANSDGSGAADDNIFVQPLSETTKSLPDILTEEEKDIIELLIGLRDGCKHSSEEVARLLNKEKGRVNQIRWRVVRKLNRMSLISKKKGCLTQEEKEELRGMFDEQDKEEPQAGTSHEDSPLQRVISQFIAECNDEDE